jgi:hypothetical protein
VINGSGTATATSPTFKSTAATTNGLG